MSAALEVGMYFPENIGPLSTFMQTDLNLGDIF